MHAKKPSRSQAKQKSCARVETFAVTFIMLNVLRIKCCTSFQEAVGYGFASCFTELISELEITLERGLAVKTLVLRVNNVSTSYYCPMLHIYNRD